MPELAKLGPAYNATKLSPVHSPTCAHAGETPEGRDAACHSIWLPSEVESIKIHHLIPCRNEVFHKLLLCVVTSVNFRNGTELGV